MNFLPTFEFFNLEMREPPTFEHAFIIADQYLDGLLWFVVQSCGEMILNQSLKERRGNFMAWNGPALRKKEILRNLCMCLVLNLQHLLIYSSRCRERSKADAEAFTTTMDWFIRTVRRPSNGNIFLANYDS